MTTEQPEELFAIVDLFGHARIAGKVSEYQLGGQFVRIDVPAIGGRPAFTKLVGEKAIYSITFVDRDVCLAIAQKLGVVPVSVYDMGAVTTEAVRNRLLESRAQERRDDDGELPW